jgi:hypothetical protein
VQQNNIFQINENMVEAFKLSQEKAIVYYNPKAIGINDNLIDHPEFLIGLSMSVQPSAIQSMTKMIEDALVVL